MNQERHLDEKEEPRTETTCEVPDRRDAVVPPPPKPVNPAIRPALEPVCCGSGCPGCPY